MSITRTCRVLRCGRAQQWKVFYDKRVGTEMARDWAKVCSHHAVTPNWPESWGTIVYREMIE